MPDEARGVRSWLRVGLMIMAAAAFTVFLLAQGSRGSEIASVLAFMIAILSAVPILRDELNRQRRTETDLAVGNGGDVRVKSARRPKFLRNRWVLLAISIGLGVALAGVYWFAGGQADLNITSDVGLSRDSNLADGARIELVDRDRGSANLFSPPRRDHLAVTFSLHNPSSTGFCVGQAEVRFYVAVDGAPVDPDRPGGIARSGDEVVLDLDEATRSVSVFGVLSMEDQECRVNLRLDRAMLYD
ncbi:hypothetical protein [Actinophytocola glycyrrhizae]|uniref:DUF4352 domain-containing protein n=1 Tax=Actinophytocola glycyrrhizae TaxID=2044873 RepID=A0ABV9S6B9_9PSEU